MRAPPVPPKGTLLPKPKLNLPPPRSPFRALLKNSSSPTAPVAAMVPLASAAAPSAAAPVLRPRTQTTARKDEVPASPTEPTILDSASRTAALNIPPPHAEPLGASPRTATTPLPVDPHVAAELVEKAAIWGDGTRGVARLRFTGRARAGLANATITLEHDGDELHLRVDGLDDPEVTERLRERLAARGVVLSSDA